MATTKESWITRKANGNGVPWNKGKKGLQIAWNKGLKTPEVVKRKISIATKLAVSNPDIRKKMSVVAKNRKFSLETRKKMGARKGEKHHNWKGGTSPLNEKIRKSFEYKLWRSAVFERDNFTCRFCQNKSVRGQSIFLHADHIKPFADFPELRFAIDNGRTLCISCHRKTETYGFKGRKKILKGAA